MDDKYKFIGDLGPELNMYPPIKFFNPFTDDTIHMKITIEVRKFWFWWKA